MERPGPRTISRGELYWLSTTTRDDGSSGVEHPHVVVQDDVFNHSRITTVVVCALTSNLHKASEPGNVLLEAGEGNLPKQSVVVVSQIDSVAKDALGDFIGSLAPHRVDQIVDGLRF